MATDKKKYEIDISPAELEAYRAKGYDSPYRTQIDNTLGQISSNQKFSYDAGTDPTYAYYKKQYTEGARKAMTDTQAQSAALTGGYGNSYGQVAGQAVYNEYMSKLGDKIPELEQAAYSRHQDEQNSRYQYLSSLLDMDNTGYSRWSDGYNMLSDEYNRKYNKAVDDRAFNYQLDRDDISDARYADELAYERANAASSGTSSGTSSGGGTTGTADTGYKLSDKATEKIVENLSGMKSTEIYNRIASLAKDGVDNDQIYDILYRLGITDAVTFLKTGGTYYTLDSKKNREAMIRG